MIASVKPARYINKHWLNPLHIPVSLKKVPDNIKVKA